MTVIVALLLLIMMLRLWRCCYCCSGMCVCVLVLFAVQLDLRYIIFPPLSLSPADNNLKHASAIIRINGAIKTKQMKLLITYLSLGLEDFKERHREECSTFSEISTTLEQLDQYSIEKPCVLVLGLCTVGRKDLANDLYRNTRCQKHQSAMCHHG